MFVDLELDSYSIHLDFEKEEEMVMVFRDHFRKLCLSILFI